MAGESDFRIVLGIEILKALKFRVESGKLGVETVRIDGYRNRALLHGVSIQVEFSIDACEAYQRITVAEVQVGKSEIRMVTIYRVHTPPGCSQG